MSRGSSFDLGNSSGDKLSVTSVLQQLINEIREYSVPWDNYFQSGIIPENVYHFINGLQNGRGSDSPARLSYVSQHKDELGPCFVFLLTHVNKDQTIQSLLVLLDDVLQLEKGVSDLYAASCPSPDSLWAPFLNLMNHREDRFIVHMSARVLSTLAIKTSAQHAMAGPDLEFFLTWLKTNLGVRDEYLQSVLRRIHMMLLVEPYREAFLRMGGMGALGRILATTQDFQVQYQLIFCLWVLSFKPELATEMQVELDLIPVLCDIVGSSHREKVRRITLAVLRNLVQKPESSVVRKENCVLMIHGQLLKQLELIKERAIDDPEMEEDINTLEEALSQVLQTLSSFDEYVAEVHSGRLEWSPVHRSHRFWIENVVKLNGKNYELLRMLVHLLETSKDPLILSVACHDLGEYVRHYSRGKAVMEQLGGKHLIMQYLSHSDSNVRYEALISLQKMMVHNWDYLGKKLSALESEGASQDAMSYGPLT